MTSSTVDLAAWIADLEARHLRDMTPTEVARALRALSSTYVERRARLSDRGAFDTAGKRAAYALYYAPRRFVTIAHVLMALEPAGQPRAIVDVGCGTGAAAAAWAAHAGRGSTALGLDVHPWALEETRATWRAFHLPGETRRLAVVGPKDDLSWLSRRRARGDALSPSKGLALSPSKGGSAAVVVSYTVNELDEAGRARLLPALLSAAAAGTDVLVVEPLSRRTSPWWPRWAEAVVEAGGRTDEWRVTLALPPVTAALGQAAGLDATQGTARTLWLGSGAR